jgi:hypothetical protein
MKQIKFVSLLISFAFSLYIWGCAASNSSKVLATVTPERTMIASIEPSLVVPNTPNLTETLTLTPTLATITLSPQDAYRELQDLFEDNGGCQLPCYWTIVPGETLWQDASAFLSSLGRIYGPGGTSKVASYGVVFDGVDKPIGDIAPIFWVENGVVKAIGINSSWVHQDFDYSLSGLLKEFGKPDEIWIRPVAESSDDQPFYYLVLSYPSKGILVNLLGNAERQDEYLAVCAQDIFSRSPFPPQLLLWDPKVQVIFDQFGKRLIDDDLGWVMNEYRPLQEASADKLTNMEFYNIYSEPDTKTCIHVLPIR